MQTCLLLTAAILAWGIATFLMKVVGQSISPYTAVVFNLPGYVAVIALVARRADFALTRSHGIAVAVGALYILGNMAYYRLCETVDISRLAPATAIYVAVPVILGWVLLREPVTLQKVIGILLAGVALYLLMAPEAPVRG